MKIIFLDFDGVINDFLTFDEVNKCNVLVLKEIIDKTGALVVVTSSKKYTFQSLNINKFDTLCYKLYIEQLNKMGISIWDFTPLVDKNRELEILKYLACNPKIEHFLILDDDYIFESLKEHQIYIDLQSGLRECHIKPAVDILNGKLNFFHDCDNLNESNEQRNYRMNLKIKQYEKKVKYGKSRYEET